MKPVHLCFENMMGGWGLGCWERLRREDTLQADTQIKRAESISEQEMSQCSGPGAEADACGKQELVELVERVWEAAGQVFKSGSC